MKFRDIAGGGLLKLMEDRAAFFALLKQHEEGLNELYSAYAERFPHQREFWSQLSEEELVHAGQVSLIQEQLNANKAVYTPCKLRTGAIESSLEYIYSQTAEARTGRILLINALSVALDLEQAIIEKKYFEAVDGDSVEMKLILEDLAEQSKEHIAKVRKAWEQHRHGK